MRVIVDGMGGDNAPEAIVKGAVKAIDEMPHQVIIVGDEKAIKRELSKYKYNKEQIIIKHASEVISGDDPPVKSIRTKKDSSMVVGFELLKNETTSTQRVSTGSNSTFNSMQVPS